MSEPAAEPDPRENSGTPADGRRPDGMPIGKPFEAGVSGNPKGRPKGLAKAVRDVPIGLGQGDGAEILAKIAWTIVANEKEKTEHRLAAWRLLAERGWGKPVEYVPIDQDDPLELSEAEAREMAIDFDHDLDELAAKRREHEEQQAATAG